MPRRPVAGGGWPPDIRGATISETANLRCCNDGRTVRVAVWLDFCLMLA